MSPLDCILPTVTAGASFCMRVQFIMVARCANGKTAAFSKDIEIDLSDRACWRRIDRPGESELALVGKECRIKSVDMSVREVS